MKAATGGPPETMNDESSPLSDALRTALRDERAPASLRGRILAAARHRRRSRRLAPLRLAAAGLLGMLSYGAVHQALTAPASPFVVQRQARLDLSEDSRAFLEEAMPMLLERQPFQEDGVPAVYRIAGEVAGEEDERR